MVGRSGKLGVDKAGHSGTLRRRLLRMSANGPISLRTEIAAPSPRAIWASSPPANAAIANPEYWDFKSSDFLAYQPP